MNHPYFLVWLTLRAEKIDSTMSTHKVYMPRNTNQWIKMLWGKFILNKEKMD